MQDGKHQILVIDDDEDVRLALRTVLEANGYAMAEAASAEEGLQAYRQQKPDLVIVDLMMEEVDAGTGFVKEIKAMGDPPPIYMLSSVGDDLNKNMDYSQLGLDGVFQKPIANDRLLSILKTKLK